MLIDILLGLELTFFTFTFCYVLGGFQFFRHWGLAGWRLETARSKIGTNGSFGSMERHVRSVQWENDGN
jgi:hypothetical protein